jgi:cell division protein FtsQ
MRAAAATLGRLPKAVVVLPRTLRLSPHGRRRLIALGLLLVALAAGYVFWLRDSSLVRVEKVTVTGIDTADGPRVRAELAVAARRMTTLHVDAAALRRAVADEPIVHSLTVETDFPHRLRIAIVQNRPVALLVAHGRQVAVAPDGSVLEGAKGGGSLPTIDVGSLPSSAHMPDGPARDRVAVAGTAPARLLPKIDAITVQHGRGVVAELKDGPVVIFGGAVELDRKWAAATAVLAQHSSQGATYIDVRMPDRPVAGGLSLEQDPQAQPESASPGDAGGTTGVVPAVPPAGAATPGTLPQTVPPATPGATATTPGTAGTTATTPAPSGTAPAPTSQTGTPAPAAGTPSVAPTGGATPATGPQP